MTGQFHDLIYTLGGRFLPLFSQLAGAAKTALTYLNKIAHLPLKQAFESLSTTGIAMLNKFVYAVANVLAKPFKLGIQIAFGSAGDNANKAIAGWWDSFTKYLFGYTATHKIVLGGHVISIDKTQVAGALDPIIKFFNSQHFVDTGLRWAREIIQGLIRLWHNDKKLRDAVRRILRDAGHQAGKAFSAAFRAEMTNIPWKSLAVYIVKKMSLQTVLVNNARDAFNLLKQIGGRAFDSIKNHAGGVISSIKNSIKNSLSTAWNDVKRAAQRIWDEIKRIFTAPLSIHVNFPSIPNTLKGLLPHTGGLVTAHGLALAAGGVAVGGVPGRDSIPAMLTPGELVLNKQQQLALLHGGMGGGDVYVQVDIAGKAVEDAVVTVQKRTARSVQAGRKW